MPAPFLYSDLPPSARPGHLLLVPAPAADRTARGAAPRHARPALRVTIALVPVALLIVIAYLAFDLWSQTPPEVVPRHRAEAVCFALAQPDPVTLAAFAPPMRIEPSAALVRGRFAPGTPAAMALRRVMRLDESMVLDESQHIVGDYAVSTLWLNLPPDRAAGAAGGGHWLVLAWMQGADLAVCNFRFVGVSGAPGAATAGQSTSSGAASRELSPDEQRWGARLLSRVLTAENFQAASLPRVGLRVMRGTATMPVFGPASGR